MERKWRVFQGNSIISDLHFAETDIQTSVHILVAGLVTLKGVGFESGDLSNIDTDYDRSMSTVICENGTTDDNLRT